MRVQNRLLQLLIGYWNLEVDTFMMDGESLTIEVDEINFITNLSQRGDMVNLSTQGGIVMTI